MLSCNEFMELKELVEHIIKKEQKEQFYEIFKAEDICHRFFSRIDNLERELYEKTLYDYGRFLTVFSPNINGVFIGADGRCKKYNSFKSFLKRAIFSSKTCRELLKEVYKEGLLNYYTKDEKLEMDDIEEDFLLGILSMVYIPEDGLCIPWDNKWGFRGIDLQKVIDYQLDKEVIKASLEIYKKYNGESIEYKLYIAFMDFILENFQDKEKLEAYNNFYLNFIINCQYDVYHIPSIFLTKLIENSSIYMDTLVEKLANKRLYPHFYASTLEVEDRFYLERFEDCQKEFNFEAQHIESSIEYALEEGNKLRDGYIKSIDTKIFFEIINLGQEDYLEKNVYDFIQMLYKDRRYNLINFENKTMNRAVFFISYLNLKNKANIDNIFIYFDYFSQDKKYTRWFSSFEKRIYEKDVEAIVYLKRLLSIASNKNLSSVENLIYKKILKDTMNKDKTPSDDRAKAINYLDYLIDSLETRKEALKVEGKFPELVPIVLGEIILLDEPEVVVEENLEEETFVETKVESAKEEIIEEEIIKEEKLEEESIEKTIEKEEIVFKEEYKAKDGCGAEKRSFISIIFSLLIMPFRFLLAMLGVRPKENNLNQIKSQRNIGVTHNVVSVENVDEVAKIEIDTEENTSIIEEHEFIESKVEELDIKNEQNEDEDLLFILKNLIDNPSKETISTLKSIIDKMPLEDDEEIKENEEILLEKKETEYKSGTM